MRPYALLVIILLLVPAAIAGGGPPDPIVFEDSITGVSDPLGTTGVFLPFGVNNHTFEHLTAVDSMTFTLTPGTTGPDLDLVVYGPNGNQVCSSETPLDIDGESCEVTNPETLAAFGTWMIEVRPYIAVEAPYTATVTFG